MQFLSNRAGTHELYLPTFIPSDEYFVSEGWVLFSILYSVVDGCMDGMYECHKNVLRMFEFLYIKNRK